MSNEAGSRECRNLIEAKENLIKIMQSLSSINNTENIQSQLREIYNELEGMHELRRKVENERD
tara:strand:+ start:1084 stop:1272 length:189 start_codon:yes stop_codon:yes gene_type:complete